MDSVRRAIRTRLGYRSPLYRWLSKLYNFVAILASEGPATACRLSRLAGEEPGRTVKMRFRRLEHPLLLRAGTSDIPVVTNNIVREEYGLLSPMLTPTFVVDAGGYIGDSSAYFASKFPSASIVTLEPHPANFAIAKRNLDAYGGRIKLLNMALGSAPGIVSISGEHDGATVGADGVSVQAIDVPGILEMAGKDRIDILKMDIEGAEADVLGKSADVWLKKVELLIIELHGPEIEVAVMETLRRNRFKATPFRSLWYCRPEQHV